LAEELRRRSSRPIQGKHHLCCVSSDMPEVNWEKRWKTKETQWDLGGVTPVLTKEVDGYVKRGREVGDALVPGCGAAYDVAFLAERSRTVTAIDLAPSAVKLAREMCRTRKNANIVLGNFFEHDFGKKFDFVFDYTFFCAIQPELRPAWGSKVSSLLSPGGRLLTLVFPIDEDNAFNPDANGPPFPVSVAAYEKVLSPHGLVRVSTERSEASVSPRRDRELVVWWEKQKQNL